MSFPLLRFGYTPREAAFIELACIGGYFVRRQFDAFLNRQSGALSQSFVNRATKLGHVGSISAVGGRIVYHLRSSSTYAALGDETNRNRRPHSLEVISQRLMVLDLVLSFCHTLNVIRRSDLVDTFVGMGVQHNRLPGEIFDGNVFHFLERFPIFLSPEGTVTFGYIDDGLKTLSAWARYLRRHRALFQSLNELEIVFASSFPERFCQAETIFQNVLTGASGDGALDSDRLVRHFKQRRLFEEKRFEVFDRQELDRLREEKKIYSEPRIEQLYSTWKETGVLDTSGIRHTRSHFRTRLLTHNYSWLTPIRSL